MIEAFIATGACLLTQSKDSSQSLMHYLTLITLDLTMSIAP